MLLNRRRVLITSLIMLACGFVLTLLIANPTTRADIQPIDDWVYDRTYDTRSDALTQFLEWATVLGGATVTWALRGGAIVLLLFRRRYLQFSAFLAAIITSELCIGPLKAAIERPRPPNPLVETSGYSYPSGHAIAIAVTAIGLVVALLPPGRRRLRWELLAAGFMFLISLSRVYLRAHWLTDVIGGSLIGSGLALFWPAFLATLRARRRAHDEPPQVETTAADGVSDEDLRAI
jgi:undecaprenyl-diphosphatase